MKVFKILLFVSLILTSCSTMDFSTLTSQGDSIKEITLEELVEEYKKNEETANDAALNENKVENGYSTDSLNQMENTSLDNSFESEVLSESLEEQEVAMPHENENITEPDPEVLPEHQITENDSTFVFPNEKIDIEGISAKHMDAIEPVEQPSNWVNAEDLVISQKESTSKEENEELEDLEKEVEEPQIIWESLDSMEGQKVIEPEVFIEGTSVSSEWDMLSEYDKFLAELGENVQEAESINTTTFIEVEENKEIPLTLEIVDEGNIEWETVEPEIEVEEKTEAKGFLARVWEAIVKFFSSIWEWIKKVFS